MRGALEPRTRRWLVLGAALAGFAAGIAACENTVQRERVATCRRAVPALAASDEGLRLLRAGSGSAPEAVRVDYAIGQRQHWAVCRFGSGSELVGITTDRQSVSGASLYMLKRFYLDTPEAEAADPGGR